MSAMFGRWSRPARPATHGQDSWRRFLVRSLAPAIPVTVVLAGTDAFLTVVTGRLVSAPTSEVLGLFAALTGVVIVGGVVTAGLWRGIAARGEARLRDQLLNATLHRTLPDLEDQAVGELLERVDDDPRALFESLRRLGEVALWALLGAVASWVTAGLTWSPAWIVFPLAGGIAALAVRGTGPRVTAASRDAEAAWSQSSAQLEEALAARDDMRSSGGQPFVLRRFSRAAATAISAQVTASVLSARVSFRLAGVLAGLTAVVVVGGAWAVTHQDLGVARFVTLFLLVTAFTRRFQTLLALLPQIQEGLGTFARVRDMLTGEREPSGGHRLEGSHGLQIELRDLTFTYRAGEGDGFGLGPVSLTIPAGQTVALVGRTGSGKTTLTKVLSRAIEPPPGTVWIDGNDIRDLEVEHLRTVVGVVGQRTEILAGTLAQNIALFEDLPSARIAHAVDALGLTDWVEALPEGMDTQLGPHGVTLSAGEQQLVAFARLLVRDVRVVVLDEATARMDPATSRAVTKAARRLLVGRTGIIVAHRLATARFADTVAVMNHGHLVEHGTWHDLAAAGGQFSAFLAADGGGHGHRALSPEDRVALESPGHLRDTHQRADDRDGLDVAPLKSEHDQAPEDPDPSSAAKDAEEFRGRTVPARGGVPAGESVEERSVRLGRTAVRTALARPRWWTRSEGMLVLDDVAGSASPAAGWVWAALVTALMAQTSPWLAATGVIGAAALSAVTNLWATRPRTLWWAETRSRLRLTILRGQTGHDPVHRASSGEITARALEEGRLVGFSRIGRDLVLGSVSLVALGGVSGSLLAVALAAAVVAVSVAVAGFGARLVGDTARVAGDARAEFGRRLGSVLEAARTIKLSGTTRGALAHLRSADRARVAAVQREDRVSYLVWQAPWLVSRSATILVWWLHVAGTWSLTTTLVVTTAIGAYGYIGATGGMVITRIPVARRWVQIASGLAGTTDLSAAPRDTDLVTGTHHAPPTGDVGEPLDVLRLVGVSAIHEDGTTGVSGANLQIRRGQTVLLLGRVGSGKSSLLAGLAGLVHLDGDITWNHHPLTGADLAGLAGTRVAYLPQVPRIVSGTIAENIHLDHDRAVAPALSTAQLDPDVQDAGGPGAVVGHRGLRLSGGQTQRLALARALAVEPDLLVIDDVSSALDATTEADLWHALRRTETTIIATSTRPATLATADLIVVLDNGHQVDAGTWTDLRPRWAHLTG